MRYAKLVRWLLVVAVVAIGLLVAADIVTLQVAESRAGAGFAQATAAERASVSLGGAPFLPRLLTGRISTVTVQAVGLSGGGLRVARVEADVQDLRFSASRAINLIRSPHAERTRIVTGPATGRAEIVEKDLEEFLAPKLAQLHDLRITPSGIEARIVIDVETGELSGPIRFLPRIENRHLLLRLVGEVEIPRAMREQIRTAVERAIDLPPIPEGLTVDATLGDGSIRLEAAAPRLELLVGEGGIRSVDPARDSEQAAARARGA